MILLLVAVFFALVLLSLPLQARLFRALRLRHTRLFEELGCPTMFRLFSDKYATPRMWRFLLLREHRALQDQQVSRLADALLAALGGAAAILLLVVVWRALS